MLNPPPNNQPNSRPINPVRDGIILTTIGLLGYLLATHWITPDPNQQLQGRIDTFNTAAYLFALLASLGGTLLAVALIKLLPHRARLVLIISLVVLALLYQSLRTVELGNPATYRLAATNFAALTTVTLTVIACTFLLDVGIKRLRRSFLPDPK
jgi:hypothetical protein